MASGTVIITESESETKTPAISCKSEDCHTWFDWEAYTLGAFCHCSTWQIIERIGPRTVLCINVQGEKVEFNQA